MRLPRLPLIALLVSLALVAGCAGTADRPSGGPGSRDPGPNAAAMRERAQPAPAWMIGRFLGTNSATGRTDVELEVDAAGRLTGRTGSVEAVGQYIGNSRVLWAHGTEAIVERRPNGFRLAQTRNPANATEYVRR
jgi:hypothetical protein